MNYLLILNDQPYGTELCYNALRLGLSLRSREGVALKIFLIGDAVGYAQVGQKTPAGAYNLGRKLTGLTSHGIPVGVCRSCMDARRLTDAALLEAVHRT